MTPKPWQDDVEHLEGDDTAVNVVPRRPAVPQGVTADDVAVASRSAALAFCRGVAAGWTKRDLAEWLVADYDDATLTVRESLLPPPLVERSEHMPRLDEDRILQVVDPAWQEAVTCIEDFAAGRESRHLDEALHRGSIVEAWLDTGESVFVPVNRPGLPLAVRLRSLLVVDFLLRSEDYVGDIRVCGECGVILLGLWARDRGHCEDHVRKSDVGPTAEALDFELELGLQDESTEPGGLADDFLRVALSTGNARFNR